MKLTVYVLSALLLFACVSAGDTQNVAISDLVTDSHTSDALKFGINWIFEQAAEQYGTSALNVQVTKVNSIKKWEDNKDTYYTFDVEATNNDDAWIKGSYTVRCEDDGDKKVTKWKYHIEWKDNDDHKDDNKEDDQEADSGYGVPDAGENVEIDVNVDVEVDQEDDAYVDVEVEADVEVDVELNQEDCEGTDYGYDDEADLEADVEVDVEVDIENDYEEVIEEVLEEVIEEEEVNKCKKGDAVDAAELETNAHLKEALDYGVNWIYKKAHKKFGISKNGVVVTQVNSICGYEKKKSTYYTFDLETKNDNGDVVTCTVSVKCDDDGDLRVVNEWSYKIDYADKNDHYTDNEDDEPTDGYEDEADVEVDVEVDVEEEEHDKCKEGDAVDAAELATDSHLSDALKYGVNWIFGKANEKYGTSKTGIEITVVNSICSWKEKKNTYYSFDVEAKNDNGDVVKCTVNVKCKDDGELSVVNKWSYDIEFNKDKEDDKHDDKEEDVPTDAYQDDGQDVEVDVEVDQGTDVYQDDGQDVEVVVEDDGKDDEGNDSYADVVINVDGNYKN